MKVRVELAPEVPARYRQALASVRDVEVGEGRDTRIGLEGAFRALLLLPRPHAEPDLETSVRDLARAVPPGAVGLVAGNAIPFREREALQAGGLSWCDGRGAAYMSWPGVLVHIDQVRRSERQPSAEGPGLGPAGIRAVQILLDSTAASWTVSRLAHEANISLGQAHNVFRALEHQRLVETTGKGSQQRRRITDRGAALDWIAGIDRTRRRPAAAATYLYARTAGELLASFAERAAAANLTYAVTAAAATQLLGVPVLSRVSVAHIRVGVLKPMDALHRLGLEHLEVKGGGNLELWTDPGEVGTFGAKELGGVRVAPPVRVWLDLARQGGRAEDAAQLFREQTLDRR